MCNKVYFLDIFDDHLCSFSHEIRLSVLYILNKTCYKTRLVKQDRALHLIWPCLTTSRHIKESKKLNNTSFLKLQALPYTGWYLILSYVIHICYVISRLCNIHKKLFYWHLQIPLSQKMKGCFVIHLSIPHTAYLYNNAIYIPL